MVKHACPKRSIRGPILVDEDAIGGNDTFDANVRMNAGGGESTNEKIYLLAVEREGMVEVRAALLLMTMMSTS